MRLPGIKFSKFVITPLIVGLLEIDFINLLFHNWFLYLEMWTNQFPQLSMEALCFNGVHGDNCQIFQCDPLIERVKMCHQWIVYKKIGLKWGGQFSNEMFLKWCIKALANESIKGEPLLLSCQHLVNFHKCFRCKGLSVWLEIQWRKVIAYHHLWPTIQTLNKIWLYSKGFFFFCQISFRIWCFIFLCKLWL